MPVHTITIYIQQSLNRIIESASSSYSNLSLEDIGLRCTHWMPDIPPNKVVKCDRPQYIGIMGQTKFHHELMSNCLDKLFY